MNLGKGFPFPQQDGDLWIPVTPQKSVMWCSNPSTIELQGSQAINMNFPEALGSSSPIATSAAVNQTDNENWEELIGLYSDLLQQRKCDIQCSPAVQSICPTNELPVTSSNSPVEPNWTHSQSASTMLNQTLCASQTVQSCTPQQMSINAFPIPYQSCYNLNAPPGNEILGASHAANCLEIAPHTPDQGKQLKNKQLSILHNFSADGTLNQAKDKQVDDRTLKQAKEKQENTSTKGQGQIHSDQLLQSVIASSPPNSTSPEEKNICDHGRDGGIDLNKTPQLKPPKRKKHRPKVVVEGKPKRTPMSTPLKAQNRTSSRKLNSVRNSLRDSTSEQYNKTEPVDAPTVQSAVKSCRRVLNFEEAKVQETASSKEANRISTIQAAKEDQQKRYSAETQQSPSICNLPSSTNQKTAEEFLPLSATAPPTTARDHMLNVIARSINLKNAMAHQTKNQLGYSKVHQHTHGEVMGQLPLHPNTALAKLDRAKQLMLQTRSEPINSVVEHSEKRGHKRDYCNISGLTHSSSVDLMHLQLHGKPMNDSWKVGIGNSEIHRESQFEDKFHEAASPMASCTATVKQSSRQVESRGSNGVHVSNAPYNYGRLQYSSLEKKNSPRNQTRGANSIADYYQYEDPIVAGNDGNDGNDSQEQRYLSKVKSQRDCLAGQLFQQYTASRSPSLLNGIKDLNMLSQPQRVPITTQANETRTPETPKAVKRQAVGLESSILALTKKKVLPKVYKKEGGYLSFSRKTQGQNEQREHTLKVDEIIYQLKLMKISNSVQAAVREKQTEIIPYKGPGTIVPYRGYNPSRTRKPRPKVDLDPETNRLWVLLMGNPGSESTETMDKDKEKWWKNEREVLCNRVDSFISRMHLVQGDRRFSRWKGSVVDSVIGVFLTQNVSDHLSSSAFMSLAAEFPMPRTLNPVREWEEPEIQIIDPDGTITYHGRTLGQPPYKHSSRATSESSEQRSGHLITETGIYSVKENNRATEEEVFSSQNSSGSLILQVNGDAQSSSDSEVEDQVMPCSANKSWSLKDTLQTERAASIQQHRSHETSPLLDNRPIPECQKLPTPVCIRQNSTSNIGTDVYDYPINFNILHPEGSFAQGQTGHMHPSTGPSGSGSTKIPNSRKRKLDEKKKSFDWDTLRQQVLLKGGNQKRCKDRMDSLNYEALRHADVNKISEIIKERGMNNMLADRIKDFLNRLVRDHGSIDLEWLRDVPPDKAKEYLLSIRGLGLKSVECVRLLTLHHIAFPVDTNVGRIAVRLGWVPLQPLPESLQLHLLELYPVLESIQKYLWPRLCKLDQKTLYELHYQMITFGKVFCTKNKPNCNACPLKGGCRHFASAFASTRLTLPGPEERSIVSSTTPMVHNGSPTLVSQTPQLPPPETNMLKESKYISTQQEPIVEEPTTPPSTEVLESDIEDLLPEDTDEIPTIDLSLEELKMNVQKFLRERYVGISEAALSKALVALNPADASIPAPKLKNVNRLRTEHQVYEIPDSHPLLEGMDRREPDDPSPYLLAIWTPGETANSTQAPESKCSFQGTGRLCNDKTCFSCNSVREANSQIVRGTLLIPCRTATLGSFPLNGTYFQVNEVFADHESSVNPINVPREWLWPLARRTVNFGSSVSAIFRGLSTPEIQYCFWRGFICVRGFDRKTRCPRPLQARLHCPANKMVKNKKENKEKRR